MAIVKSDLLKQLKRNFPNFQSKDLERLISIVLGEIKDSLKRGERVELRSSLGVFYSKVQKARISRDPKTSSKVYTPEKKTINFKMSRNLFKKLNHD